MRDQEACFRGRLEVLRGCMELLPDGFTMLEIGVASGTVLEKLGDVLVRKGAKYVGVDKDLQLVNPAVVKGFNGLLIEKTSDDHFASISPDQKYDLIFVDGDHSKSAAIKDTVNAVQHLARGGIIVLHDIASHNYEDTDGPRNALKVLMESSQFMIKLFVWDMACWSGSTAIAVDMDVPGLLELFNKESQP